MAAAEKQFWQLLNEKIFNKINDFIFSFSLPLSLQSNVKITFLLFLLLILHSRESDFTFFSEKKKTDTGADVINTF